MKGISYIKNNKHVGLLVQPENGCYLNEDVLIELLNYIKHVTYLVNNTEGTFNNNMLDSILSSINIVQEGYLISNFDDKYKNILDPMLDFIIQACRKYLTEKIIVSQEMKGPYIRHRPLYFGRLCNSNNYINVKYTELGDFNSIQIVLNELKNLYPEV
jgi:hypothetical protein